MPLQKTEAIVLKTQRSGETSKIITLYSPNFGKLKVIAKGSRGLKSRFFGTLETLNHVSVVYYFKQTREYQFLSQADIIQPYAYIKNDLQKYALATIFCELIDKTELEQTNPYLFQVLVDVLDAINKTSKNLPNYYFWFLLKFLKINGFSPDLSHCKNCKSRAGDTVRFSIADGNFTCTNCSIQEPNSVTIPVTAIQYLHNLQQVSVKALESMPVRNTQDCEMLLLSFLQYHIEEVKYLKSIKFLKQMQAEVFY